MTLVSPPALEELVRRIFEQAGASADHAAAVAGHLVEADRTDHPSHGVIRVGEYLRDIGRGGLDPAASPRIEALSAVVARVDGCWGFGQVAGRAAAGCGVEMARSVGIGAVGVVRCHHLGRMGDYVERAAEAGCVMLAAAGGLPPVAAAHGGRHRLLGSNPLAAAFPAGSDGLVLDMATTALAAGSVSVAAARGERLAPGVLLDSEGSPTTDPTALRAGGALTPFGAHKGFSLALLVELLTAGLVGTPPDAGSVASPYARQAAIFVVFRLDLWRPADEVIAEAGALLSAVRSSPPARPGIPVRVPGDPEREARAARRERLPLEASTLESVLASAAERGVPVPDGLVVGTSA